MLLLVLSFSDLQTFLVPLFFYFHDVHYEYHISFIIIWIFLLLSLSHMILFVLITIYSLLLSFSWFAIIFFAFMIITTVIISIIGFINFLVYLSYFWFVNLSFSGFLWNPQDFVIVLSGQNVFVVTKLGILPWSTLLTVA